MENCENAQCAAFGKAMLSQPMAGKSDEEIVATRDKAIKALAKRGYESKLKEYSDALDIPQEEILKSWEGQRDYSAINFYQEAHQPSIKGDKVKVFETVKEMLNSIGEHKFRCPACGEISTNPYECNSGKEMSKGKICDWKVYGLFGDLGKGTFVYCKDKLAGETIFTPIAWE